MTKLTELARYRKKSSYNVVSPYLSQVAPLVVSRMMTQPAILVECARFIAIQPSAFISVTLPHTLPIVFATTDLPVLQQIAKELSRKPSILFINHAPDILAHVFMLQGPGQTSKALSFVLQVLRDDAQDAEGIDMNSVVKSCITKLLCELVTILGDNRTERADMVRFYELVTTNLIFFSFSFLGYRSSRKGRTGLSQFP